MPGTVRKALPAGHESSNARRRDWPAGTRMGGRMAIASVLKIDAGNRMGVRVPPRPPMNGKKRFRELVHTAVHSRPDSIGYLSMLRTCGVRELPGAAHSGTSQRLVVNEQSKNSQRTVKERNLSRFYGQLVISKLERTTAELS